MQEKFNAEIIAVKKDHEIIKAWVCACSTGEEAYTLAIMLNELVEKSGKQLDIKIFATDIDEMSIDIAAKGCYSSGIVKEIGPDLLKKYFVEKNSQYQIISRIRKQIVFAMHDVIRDPPFINNDLVSCRNMLIYVNQHLQKKIYSLLMFALNRNGFLFPGNQ